MSISLNSCRWTNQLPRNLSPDYTKANLHTILDLTIQAYGFNIKMIETEESPFTGLLDSLPDSDKLAEIDAFIETASVSRKIRYQGVLLNITHSIDDKGILNVSINEHTDCNRSSDQIVLPDQSASGFIRRVFFLLESTGLKIEQEGD